VKSELGHDSTLAVVLWCSAQPCPPPCRPFAAVCLSDGKTAARRRRHVRDADDVVYRFRWIWTCGLCALRWLFWNVFKARYCTVRRATSAAVDGKGRAEEEQRQRGTGRCVGPSGGTASRRLCQCVSRRSAGALAPLLSRMLGSGFSGCGGGWRP